MSSVPLVMPGSPIPHCLSAVGWGEHSVRKGQEKKQGETVCLCFSPLGRPPVNFNGSPDRYVKWQKVEAVLFPSV